MSTFLTRLTMLVALLTASTGLAAAATAAQEATPSGTPASGPAFDQIEQEVAELRELPIETGIEQEIVDPEQVRAELEDEFRSGQTAEELAAIQRTWEAFGLIPPGTDLEQLYLDLLTEQIFGRYFPDSGRLFVVAPEGELGALQEATYAHEVVHALQDQQLGLDELFARVEQADEDEALALGALIEGDATATGVTYVQTHPELAEELQNEVQGGTINTEVLETSPPIIAYTLLFPYQAGAPFALALFEQGNFDALNAAYENPPTSTEQVLHPDRYLARDEPTQVTVPDLQPALGDGWELLRENTFGEAQATILLSGSQPQLTDQASAAAAGWDGDRYQVWVNGDQETVVWQTVWDSEQEATEFAEALRATEAVGGGTPAVAGETSLIAQDGSIVSYVLAPTAELAEVVQAELAASPPATPQASPAA